MVNFANEVRRLSAGEATGTAKTIEVTFSTRTCCSADLTVRFQPLANQASSR